MEVNPSSPIKQGGKAQQLIRLADFCNVPPFIVFYFDDPDEIEGASCREEISRECRQRELGLVAVRSSASLEDSTDLSFAGMFSTLLNVRLPELPENIKRVLSSLNNPRARDYCLANGIDVHSMTMAVIVQKMVDSRVAGVCFTRSDQDPRTMTLEACFGLGEPLVSGSMTPDTYTLERDRLRLCERRVTYQSFEVVLGLNGHGTSRRDVPFFRRAVQKLTDREIKQVAATCLEVERRLGFTAADVEWAYEGDSLFVLQARPYTGFAKALPGGWV